MKANDDRRRKPPAQRGAMRQSQLEKKYYTSLTHHREIFDVEPRDHPDSRARGNMII
jgi:hypothetical protein